MSLLGNILDARGEAELSVDLRRGCQTFCETIRDVAGVVGSIINRAVALRRLRRLDAALALLADGLRLARDSGDVLGQG